jgi:hypothetical protein
MPVEEPRRVARLDPTGHHVLCGSQRDGTYLCNREFGPIEELDVPPRVASGRQQLTLEPEPTYSRDPAVALRLFAFPPGWLQRPDGVWDLHEERPPDQPQTQYHAIDTWWRRVARSQIGLIRAVLRDRPPQLPELPARAVCQRCRTISLLVPDELRVSWPLPHVGLDRPSSGILNA